MLVNHFVLLTVWFSKTLITAVLCANSRFYTQLMKPYLVVCLHLNKMLGHVIRTILKASQIRCFIAACAMMDTQILAEYAHKIVMQRV